MTNMINPQSRFGRCFNTDVLPDVTLPINLGWRESSDTSRLHLCGSNRSDYFQMLPLGILCEKFWSFDLRLLVAMTSTQCKIVSNCRNRLNKHGSINNSKIHKIMLDKSMIFLSVWKNPGPRTSIVSILYQAKKKKITIQPMVLREVTVRTTVYLTLFSVSRLYVELCWPGRVWSFLTECIPRLSWRLRPCLVQPWITGQHKLIGMRMLVVATPTYILWFVPQAHLVTAVFITQTMCTGRNMCLYRRTLRV